MASKYPLSNDQDISDSQNDLRLCPTYQQNSNLCKLNKCYNLHMCYDYLLNGECQEFKLNGKCSYSHSLFTLHNQRVLEKKLGLSAANPRSYEIIREHFKNSKSNSLPKKLSHIEQTSISDHNLKDKLTSKQTNVTNLGQGLTRLSSYSVSPESSFSKENSLSLFNNQSPTKEKKSSIFERLKSTANFVVLRSIKSNPTNISSNLTHSMTTSSIDSKTHQFDQYTETKPILRTRHSISRFKQGQNDKFTNNDYLSSFDNNNDKINLSSKKVTTIQDENSTILSTFPNHQIEKEGNLLIRDPNHLIKTDTQMKYIFNKFSKNNQLCFLFGPGRQHLIKYDGYQIYPSGYCQVTNINQEKQIENKLYTLISTTLKTELIEFLNKELIFITSTSAAERCFEQNEIDYAIMSDPYKVSFPVEIIFVPRTDRFRSSSASSKIILSSSLSIQSDKSDLSSSDGKYHIPSTDSSIDVICGDISQIRVDLMVCVSTSETLLMNVLGRAGTSTKSQYNQRYRQAKHVLADGGYTSAKKILFVPWEMEVKLSDRMKAQKSLSNLVKWCIDEAHQLNMKSISFPSIGTGRIGLDANDVCKLMIDTANECLQQYKMDVLFVIHKTSGSISNQQPHQIFRNYLNDLCQQANSTKPKTPSIAHVSNLLTLPNEKIQRIQRTLECKRISTVSNLSNLTKYHHLLEKSLQDLFVERTCDISSMKTTFIEKIYFLIDVCLYYYVIPHIDFSKDKLTLRGDRDSCSQCLANLQKQRLINTYSLLHDKTKQMFNLNMYVSMKIDEAFAIGDYKIRIKDDHKTTFDIDLKRLEVRINNDPQIAHLYQTKLDESQTIPPKSWSSSLLSIRTNTIPYSSIYSLECIRIFEQTMPKSEWIIERVDSIENWPLYVHYDRDQSKHEVLTFHGCSFSFVQSIIHYGLHSNCDEQSDGSILLTRDALSSHILGTRRSTDGKYYMFVIETKEILQQNLLYLSNTNANLALPLYLIVYQRQEIL